jgi:hypothetical protein
MSGKRKIQKKSVKRFWKFACEGKRIIGMVKKDV